MSLLTRLGLCLLPVAVALATLMVTDVAKAAASCSREGETLDRTSKARIYYGGPNGDEVFGCLRPSGRSYLLDSATEGRNVVRLAGVYALADAFDDATREPPSDSAITLTNLRTGRQRRIRDPQQRALRT